LLANDTAAFAGASIGSGSGSVSFKDDYGTYTFADSDSVSTIDMKVYAGLNQWYLFMQTGTISPDSVYLNDMDYTAFGFGVLRKADYWKIDAGPVSIVPEGDFEIAYDSVSGSNFNAAGLLFSFDAGVAFALSDLPNLELTTGFGYDLHVVNDDSTSNGSWNFSSLQFNIGARYNF
jgi:hypothetical protein